MGDLTTANTAERVCRRRHPLEWTAAEPRKAPCTDCTTVTNTVLAAYLRETHGTATAFGGQLDTYPTPEGTSSR